MDRQAADPAAIQSPVVIMVVGAGRGPLVMCSHRAGLRAKQPVELFAIEKNPNAVVYLNQLKVTAPPARCCHLARCCRACHALPFAVLSWP